MKTTYKWEFVPTDTDNIEIQIAETGICLAVVTPDHYVTAGGYAETKPDMDTARLIAAAPDLLAALYKIDANAAESVEWIRRVTREAIVKAGGSFVTNAISKAEGREG